MVVTLSAALHVRDGRSTELQGLSAQLWDEDPLSDDFLAGAPITGSHPDFSTEFTFNLKKASSLSGPFEDHPDLYVLVEDARGREVFRSKVHKNVYCGIPQAPNSGPTISITLVFIQA